MAVYIIRGEVVIARRSAPELLSDGEVVIGSAKEIAASGLSLARMVAIWNALPGTMLLPNSRIGRRRRSACGPLSLSCRLSRNPQPAPRIRVPARSRRR